MHIIILSFESISIIFLSPSTPLNRSLIWYTEINIKLSKSTDIILPSEVPNNSSYLLVDNLNVFTISSSFFSSSGLLSSSFFSPSGLLSSSFFSFLSLLMSSSPPSSGFLSSSYWSSSGFLLSFSSFILDLLSSYSFSSSSSFFSSSLS